MRLSLVGTLLDTLRLGAEPAGDLGTRWAAGPLNDLPSLLTYEGADIWLFRRLRALGLETAVPAPFWERLRTQAFGTAALGLRVEAEAVAALDLFEQAGIPVVLIKGIARRALAVRFPYLDARPTNDVDLLLPDDRVEEGHLLLRANGYEPDPEDPPKPHHHHLPGLAGERRVFVELHRSTSEHLTPRVAWARATTGGSELEWAGRRVRVPAPTEMAWAAIMHAHNDEIVPGYRLQNYLEVAALHSAIDWTELLARTRGEEARDQHTGAVFPRAIVLRWLDAVRQLVPEGTVPRDGEPAPLDLATLLSWRARILARRPRLGRRLTERLIEAGTRALIGLGTGAPSSAAGAFPVLRQRTASRLCRLAFQAWRLARKAG